MASNLAARDKGVPAHKAGDQAQGKGIARTNPPESAKFCVFCDSIGLTVYRASDFEKDLITPGSRPSEASWAACWVCAALIDGEQWDSLFERAQKHVVPADHVILPPIEDLRCIFHELSARRRKKLRPSS